MPYSALISRKTPGLVALLLDDSASMGENLPGTSDAKWKWVARLLGFILKILLSRSTEMRGGTAIIKPRYYVHTVLYGSHPQLWGAECMDIEAAINKYTREGNSLGLGGKLLGTDGAGGFGFVHGYLARAVADEKFRESFPPMVFHLTDGESQTDASQIAEQIKQLATADGNVLIVNAYIGTRTNLSYQGPQDFPGYLTTDEVGTNRDNLRLFHMSSVMPDTIHRNLKQDGIFPNIRAGSRLFFDVRSKGMLQHCIQVIGSMDSRAVR